MTSGDFRNKGFKFICSLLTASCLLLLSLSCGKKSPPTLKGYERPQSPSGLFAIHREDSIILFWSYPDNLRQPLKGFHVFRQKDGSFAKIAFIANDKGSFIDKDFKENNTYRYKVIAESMKGTSSDDSNTITVMPRTLPSPPGDIRFEIKSDSIFLSWKSYAEGVCYNIYKTTERGRYGEAPLNREPVCGTSFKDSSLFPDKTVYYSMRALLKTEIKDEGYASGELEINPSHFVPSPPSDLRIVSSDGKAYLLWEASPESWTRGYRIYRRIDGESDFKMIGEVKAPAFTDTGKIDKKVWYMIKALGPEAESEPLPGEISVVAPL